MTQRLGSLLPLALVLALPPGAAVAKNVDWAALNPGFRDAAYVKDSSVCYGCHAEYESPFSHTAHARAFKSGRMPATGECESCHGPRGPHAENPDRSLALTAEQYTAVCAQCHEGGGQTHWRSGAHASAGVGCTSCHTVMRRVSQTALLSDAREDAVCYQCHTNVRGAFNRSSHHPVREGKMSCSGCHNPHGTVTAGMVKGASVNETCFGCHQEKRGPFVWVHPPVIENCLGCHEPHGSNNRKLQTSKDAFLCLTCHTYGGHVNMPRYNRTSNPYGEGCVNCHMAIHGSNSPSGAKLTR
jgi:DmsE family decaheme c-type cytochrome